jgi:hypothetical protein
MDGGARHDNPLGNHYSRYDRPVRHHLSATLQRIFATKAVSFIDGVLIVGMGITLFAVIESEKHLRLSFRRR